VEAIKGQRTNNEIASGYGIGPHQVTSRQKQSLKQLPEIFSNGRARNRQAEEEPRDKLYQQSDRLKVKPDPLKRVARLLRRVGLEAIDSKLRLSRGGSVHQTRPGPLQGPRIRRLKQVWRTTSCISGFGTGLSFRRQSRTEKVALLSR
jgi:hypothetical protein